MAGLNEPSWERLAARVSRPTNPLSLPSRMVDAAVVATLVAAVVLCPWRYDEGWVDLTILNAKTTGVYSYVIKNNDAPLTFVKSWYALLNMFCFPSLGPGHVYFMRIPGLALAVTGWAALVAALRFLELRSLLARAAAGFVWAITGADFLVSLRPEAAYVVPLAIAVVLSLEWIRAARRSIVLAGLALTSVSAGAHPCSLLVPLVLMAAAPFGRPDFSWRDARWMIPAIVAAAGVAAMMIFWDQSPQAFFDNLAAAADREHTVAWRDEWLRYVRIGFYYPAEGYAYLAGLLVLPLLLWSTRIAWRTRAALAVQILAIGLFLLIYPAKWAYYVAAYAPWISIAWAYAGEALTRKSERLPALPAAFVVVLAYYSVTAASERYAPSVDPNDASLLRVSILGPLFGVPTNDQEKLIGSIPGLVGDCRVLVEPYMFPMLNPLSLNKASFDDSSPPEFLIAGQPEFVNNGDWSGEPSAQQWARWPKIRWMPVLRFRLEGNPVVVAKASTQ